MWLGFTPHFCWDRLTHMVESEKVSLEKLRQALAQPNNAIRKRALSIIYNEAQIEAVPLIEDYLGQETEPDLQSLAVKVLKKLQEFKESSSQVPTDSLLALLQHPNLENRILALRGLADHKSPKLAEMIAGICARETSPEALGLIAKILKQNPSPGNIPLLIRLIRNPVEEIRQEALEAILSIIFGCLYPLVLKCLLDQSAPLKMRAYQLISNISRTNLLEALDFMFSSGNPELSRLAGRLLPSFLGHDLLPMLERTVTHPDPETAALCKRATILLSQKGSWEASALMENLRPNVTAVSSSGSTQTPAGPLKKLLDVFPAFLTEPMASRLPKDDPLKLVYRMRETVIRFTDFLVFPFVTAYFTFGNRNPFLDRACFKLLHLGTVKCNPTQLIRTISPAFPAPVGKGDLFPIVLADRIQNDFNDHLLEQIEALQKLLQSIGSPLPEPTALITRATKDMGDLLSSLSPISANRLAVKYTDQERLKVANFMVTNPIPIDPKLLQNFELQMNAPLLISGNSGRAIPLVPFFMLDSSKKVIVRIEPGENDLWDYLSARGILDGFFAFLKEKSTVNV